MNKKYFFLMAVLVVALAVTGTVYAYHGEFQSSNQVQQVFDAHRTQMQAQKEQRQIDFVNKAVSDGKLTQDQANKILAKKIECEAFRNSLQGKTPQEVNTAMQARREELKKWASDNNIPMQYLMMGNRGKNYLK